MESIVRVGGSAHLSPCEVDRMSNREQRTMRKTSNKWREEKEDRNPSKTKTVQQLTGALSGRLLDCLLWVSVSDICCYNEMHTKCTHNNHYYTIILTETETELSI